jgi:hypothetical protein
MRRTRNRRNKRGGVDNNNNNNNSKENILVDEIKNHIGQTDGNLPNLDNIMQRALDNPKLIDSANNDNDNEYRRQVITYLRDNWTNNGEVIGSSPRHPDAVAADYLSDSGYSDYSDNEGDDNRGGGGSKSRRRRRSHRHRRHRTIKKSRKVRKSRKSRH